MLEQILRGRIEHGSCQLQVMLGRPDEGKGTGYKPFPAVLDPSRATTAIPRAVAMQLILGFRDTDKGPEFEDTVKIGYGFFDPGKVQFFSNCVADIVEGLGGVIIGGDQINHGELRIDEAAGTWEWELPKPRQA